MDKTQFRYNPKTLRYEQVRFSFWRSGLTLFTYLSFGFLFFIGLNFLQNILIETDLEKALVEENNALTKYKAVLASQLDESNTILGQLKTEEDQLNEKLFEMPATKSNEVTDAASTGDHFWSKSDASFDEQIIEMDEHLTSLKAKAQKHSQVFSDRMQVKKADLVKLINLPCAPPVKNLMVENLVSGFGIRINPFHKGNYHHDGIDIALTKGTEVVATGNGTISSFSLSNLEGGYENYIEIDHGNGIVSRYSHLDKINVIWGQKINQGQVIGLSGSSGGSVAPHLHYEIVKNGRSVDPLFFIVEGINPSKHMQLAIKSKVQNQSLD